MAELAPESLTVDMYQRLSADSGPSHRFGLVCGQISVWRLIKNAGWYNAQGEKLGWGDLSCLNTVRIARELQSNEMFVILDEQDSYWRTVKSLGYFGAEAIQTETEVGVLDERLGRPSGFGIKDEFAEKFPGSDFIAQRAKFVITQNEIAFPSDAGWHSTFSRGISRDIPRDFEAIQEELDVIARHDGREVYDKRRAIVWPGEDIQQYAQATLQHKDVDRLELYLRVMDYAV